MARVVCRVLGVEHHRAGQEPPSDTQAPPCPGVPTLAHLSPPCLAALGVRGRTPALAHVPHYVPSHPDFLERAGQQLAKGQMVFQIVCGRETNTFWKPDTPLGKPGVCLVTLLDRKASPAPHRLFKWECSRLTRCFHGSKPAEHRKPPGPSSPNSCFLIHIAHRLCASAEQRTLPQKHVKCFENRLF